MPLTADAPVWIADNPTLAHYCLQWSHSPRLALDTEFIRTETYYPIPGLVQIATDAGVCLIDPLAIDQWQPLKALLENPQQLKVIHSCSEDLDVLQILTGARVRGLFDTQLAAAYAGMGYALSYQKLAGQLLGIALTKEETRSDWCQRPLTEAQKGYAAQDVLHLLTIHSLLQQRLADHPRDWLAEDCARMQSSLFVDNAEEAWKDVKLAWQLRAQQRAVLQALCLYREKTARQRDVPRNRVLPKASLWHLARHQPDSLTALAGIPGMTRSIAHRDGQQLLALIKTASATPRADYPPPLPGPLPKKARVYGQEIKAFIRQLADQLELPVDILLPSRASSPILRSWLDSGRFALPASLQGWRREIIGRPLIDKLNNLIDTADHETTGIRL